MTSPIQSVLIRGYPFLGRIALPLRFLHYLLLFCPQLLNYLVLNQYTPTIHCKKKALPLIWSLLKNHWFFDLKTLSEMTVTDLPKRQPFRFQLAYFFLSYRYTFRVTVTCFSVESSPVQSITLLYPAGGWLEREIWDLFGLFFEGNADLRRLLTDYGFHGHPLRKDFPLSGFYEIFYDDRRKQIVYKKISFAQEFRDFRTQNPWAHIKRV